MWVIATTFTVLEIKTEKFKYEFILKWHFNYLLKYS